MLPSINRSDITDLSQLHGNRHAFHGAQAPAAPVAEGHFHLSKTLSGMLVHMSELIEDDNAEVSCDRSSEFTVGVLLEGDLTFSLDDTVTKLSVAPGERPLCFAFNILGAVRWRRKMKQGSHVKKALVCLPHNWLQSRFKGHSALDMFVQKFQLQHTQVLISRVDFTLHKIAQDLIESGKQGACEFELEGLALTLMVGCLKSLQSQQDSFNKKTATSHVSLEALKICQFLERNILNNPVPVRVNLHEIARELGMSVSSAQRQFKADFKQTIMEYVRARRLEAARAQLIGGTSIGEVAYLAGYTHTPNFSLAFKKYFGRSPGEFCQRDSKHQRPSAIPTQHVVAPQ